MGRHARKSKSPFGKLEFGKPEKHENGDLVLPFKCEEIPNSAGLNVLRRIAKELKCELIDPDKGCKEIVIILLDGTRVERFCDLFIDGVARYPFGFLKAQDGEMRYIVRKEKEMSTA